MAYDSIILGDGVFAITTTSGATATDVGLTRGGGQFLVERDFRDIEADGDMGPVSTRVRIIREVPKLTIRGLELLQTNITAFYPGTTMDNTNSTEWTPRGLMRAHRAGLTTPTSSRVVTVCILPPGTSTAPGARIKSLPRSASCPTSMKPAGSALGVPPAWLVWFGSG